MRWLNDLAASVFTWYQELGITTMVVPGVLSFSSPPERAGCYLDFMQWLPAFF